MDSIVFCVYLLAVYELTLGDNSGDLTPREVLSDLNRMHEDFPNKMIKPILTELENRPNLMTAIKNKELELRAAHKTDSVIKLNPVNMSSSTSSMEISHAANSEFQMKPQMSNGVISIERNSLRKSLSDLSYQNKIYLVNIPSQPLQENDDETDNNQGIIYLPNSARKVQIVSANSVDNLPRTILISKTDIPSRLVTSISNAPKNIEQRVLHNLVTLANQQRKLVSELSSARMITNPRRVLLRQYLPRRIVLPRANIVPVFNSPPLLTRIEPVGINPVPIPLPPLIPLNAPVPVPMVPVGMAAPLRFVPQNSHIIVH